MAIVLLASITTLWAPSAMAQGEPKGSPDEDVEAPDAWRERARINPADDGNRARTEPELARPVTGEPDVEPEDVGLAVPRVILGFPRVVTHIAFTPIHGLAYVAGKYKIPEHVIDILYNDERTAAFIPYVSFLGGQGLSGGFTAFHGGLGKHEERISLSAKFGGRYEQSYGLSMSAPRVGGSPLYVEVETSFEIEPTQAFFGLGPGEITERDIGLGDPPPALVGPREQIVETEFRQRRGLIKGRAGFTIADIVQIGAIGALNRRDFGPSESDSHANPSIERVYDTSRIEGFDTGYTLIEPLADFRVDTRHPDGATNSGVHFYAFGGGPPPQQGYGFIHYGGALTGFIDLWGGDRILVLHAAHESVIGDSENIPFAELPRLGGPKRLRGYDLNRFRDRHTALAVIEYQYPVHDYVAGALFFEMGSVGPDYLEMVQPENYRFGGGFGLLFRTPEAKLFSLQLAYGEGVQFFITSDPFDTFSKTAEEL